MDKKRVSSTHIIFDIAQLIFDFDRKVIKEYIFKIIIPNINGFLLIHDITSV